MKAIFIIFCIFCNLLFKSVKDMPTTVVAIFFQYVTDFSRDVLSLNGHLRIESADLGVLLLF